jgi:glycosyltransferase involved in cell wall biosynthesis
MDDNVNVPNEILLTILATCYNEEQFIAGSLQAASDAAKRVGVSYELIVIDDCSTDGSVEVIQEFRKQHPDIPLHLHQNKVNQGFAFNYVDGAFLGRGKFYHLVCGDDSMPVEYLVDAYSLLGVADMIIPYQIQGEVQGKAGFRKVTSNLFTSLVNVLGGYKINYYNGMPVHLRYNVMRWHPVSYGFGFQADILTMLLDRGASYVQIYSRSVDKKGNASTSISLRNFLSVAHTLLEVFIRRIRRTLYGKSWPRPREIPLPTTISVDAEKSSAQQQYV